MMFFLAGCFLDLVFVIDTSDFDSRTNDFANLIAGSVGLVQVINQAASIARNGTHVAAISYSDTATTTFSLNQYYDLNGVISGLNSLQPANNFITNTAAGLDQAIRELQANSRPNPTRRIVVHISNSRFDNLQQAILNANRLKALFPPFNPCLYAVAILPDVDLDESRQISTDPSTVVAVQTSGVSTYYQNLQQYLSRCYCTPSPGLHFDVVCIFIYSIFVLINHSFMFS